MQIINRQKVSSFLLFCVVILRCGKLRAAKQTLLLYNLLFGNDEMYVEEAQKVEDKRNECKQLLSVNRHTEDLVSVCLYCRKDAACNESRKEAENACHAVLNGACLHKIFLGNVAVSFPEGLTSPKRTSANALAA